MEREQRSEERKVKDPRTEEESVHANDLLNLDLVSTHTHTQKHTKHTILYNAHWEYSRLSLLWLLLSIADWKVTFLKIFLNLILSWSFKTKSNSYSNTITLNNLNKINNLVFYSLSQKKRIQITALTRGLQVGDSLLQCVGCVWKFAILIFFVQFY